MQHHDENDHNGFVYRQLVGRNHHRVQRGGQRLNGVSADHGTHQAEFAAGKQVSPQSDRQNRVHFQIQADIVRVCGIDAARGHKPGKARQKAADDVGDEFDSGRVQADDARRAAVDSDALHIQAERREFEHEHHQNHGARGKENRGGNRAAGDVAAVKLIFLHADVGDLPAGDQLGDSAPGGKQNQCCHHGLNVQPRYQKAVEGAAQHGYQKRRGHRQEQRILERGDGNLSARKDLAADGGRHRHHRADADILPAGGSRDKRHADGQNHQLGGPVDDIHHIAVQNAVAVRYLKKIRRLDHVGQQDYGKEHDG